MALVQSFAQEVVQVDELTRLFANKANPVAYDGFEPSGRMHIAQGVMKALNVNKLSKCGVHFKFWCAPQQQNGVRLRLGLQRAAAQVAAWSRLHSGFVAEQGRRLVCPTEPKNGR